jgi:aminoglycoside phosphotransferase (APT) family kinase protein
VAPLTGGVSSDIFLVTAAGQSVVVKRALGKLRVKDDWFADVSRNRMEQSWFRHAARVTTAVPRVLFASPEAGWFAMEYLGEGWRPWKSALMEGAFDRAIAREAGRILGLLHAASWGDAALEAEFDTLRNFTELRIQPYLLTAADRVPAVGPQLRDLAAGLSRARTALVHGDYSPKNLMVKGHELVVLDAEVAWYGDPAFDAAFLINHLLLKALYHSPGPLPEAAAGLVDEALSAYRAQLGARLDKEFEARLVRLVLGLMLARVHGKSPVEYLDGRQRSTATDFVLRLLPSPPRTIRQLEDDWLLQLHRNPQAP